MTSPDKLAAHLQASGEHDVFTYRQADREIVLDNDCRAYPLRVRATYERSDVLNAFKKHCESTYGVCFRQSLPDAEVTRLPGLIVKLGLYYSLSTIQLHFYKNSDLVERRHFIEWLLHV